MCQNQQCLSVFPQGCWLQFSKSNTILQGICEHATNNNIASLPIGLLLSCLGKYEDFSSEENFKSWDTENRPLVMRLLTSLSRWFSPITCKNKSNSVRLSFSFASLLSMQWLEVMSIMIILKSMCHFFSACMAFQPNKHKRLGNLSKSPIVWVGYKLEIKVIPINLSLTVILNSD